MSMDDDHASERRVFGPPGTGKTSFIKTQVDKWVREYGSDALIVASFTRSAAAELDARDLPIDPAQIGTLHSLAFRSIGATREQVTESHVRDFNEAHPAYRVTVGERMNIEEPISERPGVTEGDKLNAQMEILRARMTPRALWPAGATAFYDTWSNWKRECGYIDFTDMIELALENVGDAPGNPTIGCFDEVQDFTPVELALVRRWGRRMQIVLLAGDDDQCIYAFKGATPDAFLDPPIPPDRKRVLSQSYRVPGAVHSAASKWVGQLTRREPKEYAPRADDDGNVVTGAVRILERANYRTPEIAVADALDYWERGMSVMFLTTCSFMLDPLKVLLRREGVPFHNPYRRRRGDWNPILHGTPRRRTAVDRLLAYLRLDIETWGDDARWWNGEDLKVWSEPIKQAGVFTRGMKDKIGVLPGMLPVDSQWFDTELLDERYVEQNAAALMSADPQWFLDHLLASKRKPFEYPVYVAKRRGGALLRETPRVVIGTIHSVKGGQADVVYLFPDLSPPGMREWETGGELRDGIVRQMYVGMTRARDTLVLCGQAGTMSIDPYTMMPSAA